MEFRIVKMIALVALWMGASVGLSAQTVVEYIHTDALGTPVAVTNAAGTVIERSVYEPYGQLINRPLTDGPGFTGHVQDAATGLTYMQQRYYDPMIGRFLSVDPVTADSATGANFNRYWYANNNPYKFTDPDGRQVYMMTPPGDLDTESAGMLIDTVPIANDIKPVFTAILNPTLSNITSAAAGLTPAGDAARVVKVADKVAETAKAANKLPKPPTGPGAVARADRDPKRLFTPSEREAKRAEQGNQCGNGCGTKIDESNSRGHHVERHADGGKTVSENHAEVCTECHNKLHSGE